MSVYKLEPLRWRHEFQVEGTRPFPYDMLRYDSCFPATSADACVLESLQNPRFGGEEFSLRLVHHDARQDWHPEVGRWKSFLWRVDES